MKLEGIHHITAITGDAPAERRLLRPRARACGSSRRPSTRTTRPSTTSSTRDEKGAPGTDITFFEYPGARRGPRRAPGWCTASRGASAPTEALDFWAERLGRRGRRRPSAAPTDAPLRRPRGARATSSRVVEARTSRSIADHPEIPGELALQGFDGVRAYAHDPEQSRALPRGARSAFERAGGETAWEARGEQRGGFYRYDRTDERGVRGRGHRAPRRVGVADRTSTRRGSSGSPRPAPRRRP